MLQKLIRKMPLRVTIGIAYALYLKRIKYGEKGIDVQAVSNFFDLTGVKKCCSWKSSRCNCADIAKDLELTDHGISKIHKIVPHWHIWILNGIKKVVK